MTMTRSLQIFNLLIQLIIKITLFLLLITPNVSHAEISDFVGSWVIEVIPDPSDALGMWREIKYPAKLNISLKQDSLTLIFTDQYDNECEAIPLITNRKNEIIFTYCSGLGTKHPESWSPIHHAKYINGKIHGVVTSQRYLFKWIGTKGE